MAKRKWKVWSQRFTCGKLVTRTERGYVRFVSLFNETTLAFSPAEARRLFQKLSSDYRD